MASLQILAVASMIAFSVASPPPLPRLLSPSPSPQVPMATPESGPVMTTCVGYVCPSGWSNRPAPENLGCLSTGCTDHQCCLQPAPAGTPVPVVPQPVVPPPPPVPAPAPTPSVVVPTGSGTAQHQPLTEAQIRKDLKYDQWPPAIRNAVSKVKNGGEKAIKTLEALPVSKKVEYGVAAGVGAAALGGIIGGIAHAANDGKQASHNKQPAIAARGHAPPVVDVVKTVYVGVTPAPGTVPVAGNGIIAKYKQANGQTAGAAPMIGGSLPQGTLMAVAAFVLFGAFALGMTGLVIYKLRPRVSQPIQSRTMSRFDRVAPQDEEPSDSMERQGSVEDSSPLLA